MDAFALDRGGRWPKINGSDSDTAAVKAFEYETISEGNDYDLGDYAVCGRPHYGIGGRRKP